MSVRRIVPDLHAEDPGASREFFVEVLGLEVAMDQGWLVTFAAPGEPTRQISVMSEMLSAPPAPHDAQW